MKMRTAIKCIAILIISLFLAGLTQIGFSSPINKIELDVQTVNTNTSFDPFTEGWTYRKQITISHTNVASNLIGFPVFINITDSDLMTKAQSDGDDILFMDDIGDARQLNHEIEIYNSSKGELLVWVNIPIVSATNDTIFYMYYGNPDCTNQQHVAETWDSHYVGVWHMDDTTTTTIQDSTSGDHTGEKESIDHPMETSNGKIADAQFFDDEAAITCDDSDDFSMTDGSSDVPFTLELWMNPTTIDNHHMLLTKDGEGRTEWIFQYYGYLFYPRFISIMLEDDSSYIYLFAKYYYEFQPNLWYHFMVTYDGSSSLSGLTLYFNGAPVTWTETLDTGYVKMSNTNAPLFMGKFDYPDSKYYHGILDEVRISKGIARSEGWVQTCYQNQNNPSNFISMGSEETIPFVKTILFGKITNLNTGENSMTFSAIKLRCLRFSPLSFKTYSSNEHFIMTNEYRGLITPTRIITICQAYP